MIKEDVTRKIAEAYYLKRMRGNKIHPEGIPGDADGDWKWAENCIEFFEKESQPDSSLWQSDLEDFGWIEPLYNQLTKGDTLRGIGY